MRRARRWLWLLLPLLVSAVGWGWWVGTARVREARRELAQLTSRRQELVTSTKLLARDVAALQRESEVRARAAREALDVVAPNEVLVIVPSPTATSGPRVAATATAVPRATGTALGERR
jgi:cell division protein FtsB